MTRLPPGADHHHAYGHDETEESVVQSLESNPIWQQENVTLSSVGVDIGSSGTQVVFSSLHLRRSGMRLTGRYEVVERTTLFESDVAFTPYTEAGLIDAPELGSMLDHAYRDAHRRAEDIDTGVVIITGEALRRENAEHVMSIVSTRAGDMVCATAGHQMEAMLAAHGSGSVELSRRDGARILNVDVGGGTTKLSLIDHGRVMATAALNVGGRSVVVDRGVVTRLDPDARAFAAASGHRLEPGERVAASALDDMAATMADVIVAALREPVHAGVLDHYLTDPIGDVRALDGIVFSGGVSEYVYGIEKRDFGDLGRRLGKQLRTRIDSGRLPAPVVPASERIKATVLGAAGYCVQLSGVTSFIPSPEQTLPLRNVQVARPPDLDSCADSHAIGLVIRQHLANFGLDQTRDELVLAIDWSSEPDYARVRQLADGIVEGLSERISSGQPVLLILDADIALSLGRVLRDELGVEVPLLVLDGVELSDFDYVDLGRLRLPSMTVPVTIKSLVFGAQKAASAS